MTKKNQSKSHFYNCLIVKSQQTHVWKDDFKILNGNYKSSVNRKINEVLCIRTLKPTLNVIEK